MDRFSEPGHGGGKNRPKKVLARKFSTVVLDAKFREVFVFDIARLSKFSLHLFFFSLRLDFTGFCTVSRNFRGTLQGELWVCYNLEFLNRVL